MTVRNPPAEVIRAYSTIEIKSYDDDQRTFEGIASTPSTDHADDIVESLGAQYKLPIPLLWQHGRGTIKDPIGWVTEAELTDKGIKVKGRFAKPDPGDPPSLMEDLNRCWALVKKKLVRGLSIGFKPLEWSEIKGSYGLRYLKWHWLELSAVAIPSNMGASITLVKSFDYGGRAAPGAQPIPVVSVAIQSPGASGPQSPNERNTMKTIAEQIAAFEAKRANSVARMTELMTKSADAQETLSEAESQEYDQLAAEVKAVEAHIVRLKAHEALMVQRAVAVQPNDNPDATAIARPGVVRGGADGVQINGRILSVAANVEKGVRMARFVMAQVRAQGNMAAALQIIQGEKRWMDQTPEVALVAKAAVAAGDTTTAGWASELVYAQNLASEFVELLRPQTILGKLTGMRRVPFNIRIGSVTAGGTGYWVGQGKPIPVSKLTTGSITLGMAKAAGLLVIDEELAKSSSPSAETLVRDDLIRTNATFLDVQFVDPNVAAVANVNPASMTNGLTPVAPTGTDATALRNDVKTLFNSWIQNNLDPSKGAWIMSPVTALSISLMMNALGQPEFPTINMNGGTFMGLPVVTSMSANIPGSPDSGNMIILINTDEVLMADEGQMVISVSNEATIEMSDTPANQSTATVTAASGIMVSMYQTNSLAIKGVRWVNWGKRRSTAVQYIKEAAYA